MSETILAAEPAIRLAAFLGVLAAMTLWEVAAPRRRREISRVVRWTNNMALVVVDTVILRLSFPIIAVGLAVMAEDRGWGLFNNTDAPVWLAIVISMLLLDLSIYLQHVMFHAEPGLWRLHRMHHADLDFDATTGLRFHPVEILISMGIKLAVVAALGPRPARHRGAAVRGDPERHSTLQPRQYRPAASGRSGPAPLRRHPGHAPRPPIPSTRARPTRTSASTCRGGTGCSAPTSPSQPGDMRGWRSASSRSERPATSGSTGC